MSEGPFRSTATAGSTWNAESTAVVGDATKLESMADPASEGRDTARFRRSNR
ncbi:hypothetical protein [Natrinema caseinilyticum]|uniref:hypothetical protein n=1 Tax=Natrinema caseinilyticum TaxID=2961570 RepID=UPI0020C4A146|nr:hypothetical protein [Natrinema caseinilyticum]